MNVNQLTWGEFKRAVEAQGILDDDHIGRITIIMPSEDEVSVSRDPAGEVEVEN